MLKKVLSLLLSRFYSKKDAALVAHQAMPNFENAVALSLTTDNDGPMADIIWRFFPAKL